MFDDNTAAIQVLGFKHVFRGETLG